MRDLSSLARDQTCAPCNGNDESQPLGHQGNLWDLVFLYGGVFLLTP